MSRVGVIAAGGEGRRTGLSEYTNKAALPLVGKSLLRHQIDFLRASGVERAHVICRPAHARLLGRVARDRASPPSPRSPLSPQSRSPLSPQSPLPLSFILSDCATGWAGEVERASAFVDPGDEVILVSCDNFHDKPVGRALLDAPGTSGDGGAWLADALFTYTTWSRTDAPPTQGPVLARITTAWGRPDADTWVERPGVGHVGDLFTGYAVVRGKTLVSALGEVPRSRRGEKEMTGLLEALARSPRCRAVPYPGEYLDVADLPSLARLDARLRGDPWDVPTEVGAGVILHDAGGRVMLCERQDGRGWVPPGGLVDRGESYSHAAVREVAEEVGIAVSEHLLRLVGVYCGKNKTGGPGCSVIFSAGISAGARVTVDGREAKRAEWFGRDDVVSITIPFQIGRAVDDFFAGRELDAR